MAAKTKLEINSFVRGLITEAGALTFPDNASLVNENLVLNKDGSQQRRLGMDFEDNFQETHHFGDVDGSLTPALSIHLWKNPVGDGSYDFVIVQTSNVLRFYTTSASSLSNQLFYTFTLPADYPAKFVISTASLSGRLVVTFGVPYVAVFTFNSVSSIISVQYTYLQIRDIFGIEDSFNVETRPTYPNPLTPADVQYIYHEYNLRNQGWPLSATIATGSAGTAVTTGDPTDISPATSIPNNKPSNADVYWRARTSNASVPAAVGAYSPFELVKNYYGTSPAPRGKNIIDIFNRSVSRQAFLNQYTGNPSLLVKQDKSVGFVSQVSSYQGRFFYSVTETSLLGGDQNSPHLSTMVFFSKTIAALKDVGVCYTEADTTSEFIFDPIATDGGFISIPEAGEILKMAPLGGSLFVFARNGIWEIHGGDSAFSATNVSVSKTSDVGALGASSVVTSEVVLSYWGENGIYIINIDPTSQRGTSTSITANTVQTLYISIPLSEKRKATGVYDNVNRRIRWLYSDTVQGWLPAFTKELVFDVDLKAFYTNKFAAGAFIYQKVIGVINLPTNVIYLLGRSTIPGDVFYTFGFYKNTLFKDFGGADAPATLLTGYLTGGAGSSSKQVHEIITHFKRTETGFHDEGGAVVFTNPSSCLMTPQWEWTNSPSAGKWGQTVQVYRLQRPYYPSDVNDPFDYGYTVITAKSGIRGRGRALSLKFESQSGRDMHILGWGLEVEVEQQY